MSHFHYKNLQQFGTANAPTGKWVALTEAVRKSQDNPQTFARSLGAAVTYWQEAPTPTDFTNSRMYQTFFFASSEEVAIEVAGVDSLTATSEYDDTCDQQQFKPLPHSVVNTVTLRPGELLGIAANQAWRYPADNLMNHPQNSVGHFRVTLVGVPLRPFEGD